MSEDRLIYLDYNATTPVDPRVLEAMVPFFLEDFGNPASRQHRAGVRGSDAVEDARRRLAGLLGADSRGVVWTSGATESNNLAIKGVAAAPAYAGRKHIVTVATEHKAVLDPCFALEEQGFEVTCLGVDGEGRLDLERLAGSLREDTLLVSVMHANNEIGVLHPIGEIGRLCHARGVLFHTDATQSFGKEPIDVEEMRIDLLSLSAHKLYGPKGVGALFVRQRRPRVRCRALFDGGGHERGMRSGSLNVPGIVGLARAAELAHAELDEERRRLTLLRDSLEDGLDQAVAGVTRNGAGAERLATTSNLSFAGVDAESLMRRMSSLAASSSSACTSASIQPSHVLGALGLSRERIDGSVRFSVGRPTTEKDVQIAIERVTAAVTLERAQWPLPACGT